jgi:WD40 repeat protein
MQTGRPMKRLSWLVCVAVAATSPLLAQEPKLRYTLEGHTEAVSSVAFSPNSKALASGGSDGSRLWDVETGKNTATFMGHSGAVAFSPDGNTLAAGGERTIKLLDIATGRSTAILNAATQNIRSVAFSPNGKTLASGSGYGFLETLVGEVELWDVASGRSIANHQRGSAVDSVVFSPDGKTLAWGCADAVGDKPLGDIVLYDVASGKKKVNFGCGKYFFADVHSVAFSPNGETLASGHSFGTVKLWDVATGTNTATLNAHDNKEVTQVTSLAFSADGKTLAAGSWDKTIKLWDVATGNNTATLQGHTDSVLSVAFSADGKTFASGSRDKTIRLWDVKEEAR